MKTVELTTAQNITIEYELAPLRERIFAFVLDVIIVLFASQVLKIVVGVVFSSLLDSMFSVVLALLPIALLFIYLAGMEIFNGGQTFGKKQLQIRTVRLDGKDASWSGLLLRALFHLVDTLFSFGFVGILLIKTTEKGQRLGDMAAGTAVIRLRTSEFSTLHDVLQLSNSTNYSPVFPQVRSLREADMLAIKTILSRLQKFPNAAHQSVVVDLSERLATVLDIRPVPKNRVEFLRTLLRDYVVLTR